MDEQAGDPATSSLGELPMAVNGVFTMELRANQVTSPDVLALHQQTHSPEAELGLTRNVLYCPVSDCTRAAGRGQGFLSQRNLQEVSASPS